MKTKKVEKQNEVVVAEAAAAVAETDVKKPESIVDDVFDRVTTWAAKGLTVAKRGLEASARWLDGRAKVVGELATKLASPAASPPSPHA